eukprot:COSAG01_NODE_52973_length_342_cov_1.213992_2_plen_40_part_01
MLSNALYRAPHRVVSVHTSVSICGVLHFNLKCNTPLKSSG